jgi:hypothetical protein
MFVSGICQKILLEKLDKFPEPIGEGYLSNLETSIFWQIPLTSINSTLYKNAGFSLDKSYAIFPQIL